jgi:hypothetical protein
MAFISFKECITALFPLENLLFIKTMDMKKMSFFIIFLLLLTAGNGLAQSLPEHVGPRANTGNDPADGIYVSPQGNDATATGAVNAPYKSINSALAVAKSGATIILRGGTYYEHNSVRIRQSNITIKSAKGERAVIDLPLAHDPDSRKESSTIRFDPEVSGCKLQHLEIMGGYYAVTMESKWGWGGADDWMSASNIIIEDCILHDSRYDVVKIKANGKNITIRYNEIFNSGKGFSGNDCAPESERGNAEGIDNVNGANMLVQNNYIHDICTNGVYAKGGATDVVIENNLIERTNKAGILVGYDTSTDWFDLAANPQYYENIRGIVRNNLIINTGQSGIGLFASKDAQVYNNTLVNVANNAFHSAIYFGLSYQDWDPDAGRPANVNPSIHHNIVSQPASVTRPMIEIRYSNDLGGLSALAGWPTMHDNCYFIAGKKATFSDNRTASALTNAGLAAWQTHINGDKNSLEVDPALNANYMATNPLCAGMGISSPLDINTGTGVQVQIPETVVFVSAGILYIQNQVSETVLVYSITGALLYNFHKPEGKASYTIHQSKGTELIIRGSSGWAKKIIY